MRASFMAVKMGRLTRVRFARASAYFVRISLPFDVMRSL